MRPGESRRGAEAGASVPGSSRSNVPGRPRAPTTRCRGRRSGRPAPRTSDGPARRRSASRELPAGRARSRLPDRGNEPVPDARQVGNLPTQVHGLRHCPGREVEAEQRLASAGFRESRPARPRAHPGRRPRLRGGPARAAWPSLRASSSSHGVARHQQRGADDRGDDRGRDDRDPKAALPRIARRRRGCVHAAHHLTACDDCNVVKRVRPLPRPPGRLPSGRDRCFEEPPGAPQAVAHRCDEHSQSVRDRPVPGQCVRDHEQLVPAAVAQVECRSRPTLHGDERAHRAAAYAPTSERRPQGSLKEGRDRVPRASTGRSQLLGAQDRRARPDPQLERIDAAELGGRQQPVPGPARRSEAASRAAAGPDSSSRRRRAPRVTARRGL